MLFETCSDFSIERILIFSLFDVLWQSLVSLFTYFYICGAYLLTFISVDKIL